MSITTNFFTNAANPLTQTSAPSNSWIFIASSSSGQYVAACITGGTREIYISNNYGSSWTTSTITFPSNISTNTNWAGLTMSSTGQHLAAILITGAIYTSNNYGVTWSNSNNSPTNGIWDSISMSSSGKYVTASGANSSFSPVTYLSNNYGASWTQILSVFIVPLIISNNCENIYGFSNSNLYNFSLNVSATWTQTLVSTNPFSNASIRAMTSSSSCQYLAIATVNNFFNNTNHPGGVYISQNFGSTWSLTTLSTSLTWSSISMSSTGQYVAACAIGDGIYISSNYGSSWTLFNNSSPFNWSSITISSNGQYLTACVKGGGIYTTSISMDIGNIFGPILQQLQTSI